MTNTSQTLPASAAVDPRIVIEEMACALAQAQAALFAGRYQDLESCAARLHELCSLFGTAHRSSGSGGATLPPPAELRNSAGRVHQQSKVFAAALRRMRKQLDILRNVLSGTSVTYRPGAVAPPAEES